MRRGGRPSDTAPARTPFPSVSARGAPTGMGPTTPIQQPWLPRPPRHGTSPPAPAPRACARGSPSTAAAFGPRRPSGCSGARASGPRPGQAAEAREEGARPSRRFAHASAEEHLEARRRTTSDGHPLAPNDAWGHDHLWWLDRMVRTEPPLVERMTLVWHDWFATSNDGRRLAAPDAPPEQALPQERAGLVRRAARPASPATPRCSSGSPARTTREAPERELRPRDDGAVHARRRPRLHRERRARAGPGADRLPRRLGRRRSGPTTSTSTPTTTTTA